MDGANVKGLFFITGNFSDELKNHPETVLKLENHEIGYHSSAHSVRPTILEYTDVKDYDESVQIALERETSRISPLTGEILGPGGLLSLKKLFPRKSIVSFRAPGFSWSPPMLEAMRKLEINCDFSTRLKTGPFLYNGIQFYPFPLVLCPPDGYPFNLKTLAMSFRKLLPNGTALLLLHPTSLINQGNWDSIYFQGNPEELLPARDRDQKEEKRLVKDFALLVKRIGSLKTAGLINTTPDFEKTSKRLEPTPELVNQIYLDSVQWAIENFNYKPRFVYSHFLHFFGIPTCN